MAKHPSAGAVLLAAWVLFAGLGQSGCAHYKLGQAKPPFERLYVAPVRNQAGIAQASIPLTGALRDAFAASSQPRLAADSAGAARLDVTLTAYERRLLTSRPDDSGRGEAIELRLYAVITLTGVEGQDLFRDRQIMASTTLFAVGNVPNAEHQAFAELARRLAHTIHAQVTHVW